MAGPPRPVALARRSVESALREVIASMAPGGAAAENEWTPTPLPRIIVGVSGGADSLALAAVCAFSAPRLGLEVEAATIDHGLQEGSAHVAERAAEQCRDLGIPLAHVVRTHVDPNAPGGLEAAAREARHRELAALADRRRALAIVLAHTLDDQAEQVLMALARGSGTDAIAGIPRRRGRIVRPFLGDGAHDRLRIDHATTLAVCRAHGLEPWEDPMNSDRSLLRARVRHDLMPMLRETLGEHVPRALARTADLARADADALSRRASELADAAAVVPADGEVLALNVTVLKSAHPAERTRVLRDAARDAARDAVRDEGTGASSVTSLQVTELDDLVEGWHGQGPIPLPGRISCGRTGARLSFFPTPPR